MKQDLLSIKLCAFIVLTYYFKARFKVKTRLKNGS